MGFPKGVSGNPGGRPRALKEVVALARAQTKESIAALVRVRDTSDNESAVVAAANALLDRAWGKPTQPVDVAPERMDDTELKQAVREVVRQWGDEEQPAEPGGETVQ